MTRFKTNTPLNAPRDLPLEPGSTLLSDRIGFLPARQAMNRKNPMQDAVREIVRQDRDRRDPAPRSPTISTRPRRRSPISTSAAGRSSCSSGWMKQTLKITQLRRAVGERRAHPDRRGADRLFLLLRQLQDVIKAKHGFLELARLVRANLMHRKDPTRLRNPPPPPPLDPRQLQLCLAST